MNQNCFVELPVIHGTFQPPQQQAFNISRITRVVARDDPNECAIYQDPYMFVVPLPMFEVLKRIREAQE